MVKMATPLSCPTVCGTAAEGLTLWPMLKNSIIFLDFGIAGFFFGLVLFFKLSCFGS